MASILPVWLIPAAFVFSTLTYVIFTKYRPDVPLWQFGILMAAAGLLLRLSPNPPKGCGHGDVGRAEGRGEWMVRLSSRWISLGAGFGSPFNGKLTVLGWRRRGRPAGHLQEETIAARPGRDSVGAFSWPVGGPVADEDVRKGVAGHAIGPGRC